MTHRPVLLVTPWYGGNAGGVAVSSASMVAALHRIGVPVVVLQIGSSSTLPMFWRSDAGERVISLSIAPLQARGRSARAIGGYWVKRLMLGFLFRVLVRRGLRLVHFQYCVEDYDEVRAAAQRCKLPIVATFRGSEVNVHFDSPELAGVIRRLIHAAACVTTVSEGLGRTLASLSPEAATKARVIRNAVPISVWDAEGPREPGPAEARNIDVLYAGNLVDVKGPDQLIESFRLVHAERPGAKLVMIGAGPMEDELRRQVAAAGLSDVVSLEGRASRAEVLGYLHRARVLALPSRNEGMPLAAMEAQIAGVPVVAMDVGGVREVVLSGETGLVVPAGDVPAFATAMLELLGNEERRAQLGRTARDHALAAFDPLEMARQYAAIYEEFAPDSKVKREA